MSEDGQPTWDQGRSRDQADSGPEGKPQRGPGQFLAELDAIAGYLTLAAEGGFGGFHDGTAAYACATTAVIRLQSLTERAQYARYFAAVSPVDRTGLIKTRSIAAHAGHVDMDDRRFWKSVTEDMPRLLESLRRAAASGTSFTDEDIERWAADAESEQGYTGRHLGPSQPGRPVDVGSPPRHPRSTDPER